MSKDHFNDVVENCKKKIKSVFRNLLPQSKLYYLFLFISSLILYLDKDEKILLTAEFITIETIMPELRKKFLNESPNELTFGQLSIN